MDVFQLRDEVVRGYADYVRSFLTIADPQIKGYVEDRLAEGRLWPEALVPLNPAFEPGASIDELVAEGLLHQELARVFRRRKDEIPAGEPLRLHRHQEDAVRVAGAGASYVLTTGTGSGKSLAYFVPIVDDALTHPVPGRVKAIVVYPMNALANSQMEELEKFLKAGYANGRGPVTFERYTSRKDIERVIDPVLMVPLRRRWADVRERADAIKARREAAQSEKHKKDLLRAFRRELTTFQDELRHVRILDPACGSGNFLYVALAEIHNLEMEISRYGANGGLSRMLPLVTPTQLYGLEINPYARELAQVVVWIGHLQWMQAHGFPYKPDPIIDSIETIEIRDALIRHDESGRVVEAPWPNADFIVGNPPFLGDKKLRRALGDGYVDDLFSVFQERVPGGADLCCYFLEKARAEIEQQRASRAGLLATSSIRGGKNRRVLDRIKNSGDVFMAWSDEPWILDGAAVRISMVGFDDGEERERNLNGIPVKTINPDLTAAVDVSLAARLTENAGICFVGATKKAPFDISQEQARAMLARPTNPNGRPNSDVVKPWTNGLGILRRPEPRFIIDFGVEMTVEEAQLYEAPFAYVEKLIRPLREGHREARQARVWWLLARPAPDMRAAIQPLSRYIASSIVAKHRVFVWLSPQVLPDHSVVVFAREDDYFFGVLHSRAHAVWALRQGTSLEDRPRYTPTTSFETFPLPWSPGREPWQDPRLQSIGRAARTLNERREAWLNPPGADAETLTALSLTNLYNSSPPWLRSTQEVLDRAVWAAYGWDDPDPASVPDDVILGRLLALNQERASGAFLVVSADQEDRIIQTNAIAAGTRDEPGLDLLGGMVGRHSGDGVAAGWTP